MARPALLALCGVLLAAHALHASTVSYTLEDTGNAEYAIPDGMLIGSGMSAMQTEGAWNEEGERRRRSGNN